MIRLDKFLSDCGVCSRREAAAAAKKGLVTVNGKAVRDVSEKINETDTVVFSGEKIEYEKTAVYMMNKPAGYVCAAEDKRDRTVTELLKDREVKMGVFPVGRLDKDTTGLLLLTNDGELCHRLLSPKRHVDKLYYLKSDAPLCEDDIKAFAEGVYIEKGVKTLPADLVIADDPHYGYLTIHEGKFHQVKRMLEAVGKKVVMLKRIAFGPLPLDDKIAEGAYRKLGDEEKEKLIAAAYPGKTSAD